MTKVTIKLVTIIHTATNLISLFLLHIYSRHTNIIYISWIFIYEMIISLIHIHLFQLNFNILEWQSPESKSNSSKPVVLACQPLLSDKWEDYSITTTSKRGCKRNHKIWLTKMGLAKHKWVAEIKIISKSMSVCKILVICWVRLPTNQKPNWKCL